MFPLLESILQSSSIAKASLIALASGLFRSAYVALSGDLRHISKLRYWPLDAVLHDKYLLPRDHADLIASFLQPMLRLHPEKRAKASELVHHAWLDGIVVQGELDVIREAEADDLRRRQEVDRPPPDKQQRESGGHDTESVNKARLQVQEAEAAATAARRESEEERQLERDAMKPVDEDMSPEPVVAAPHASVPEVVRIEQPKKAGQKASAR
jgi:serine/threonine-protein kinase SRPK3